LSITLGDILNKIALLYSSSSKAKTYAMRSIILYMFVQKCQPYESEIWEIANLTFFPRKKSCSKYT